MYQVRRQSIGQAHEEIIRLILEDGVELRTENGEATIELDEPLCAHIEKPFVHPMSSECMALGQLALTSYVDQIMRVTPRKDNGLDAVYTYGNRLWGYPTWNYVREEYEGDGRPGGIDQISALIERLKQNLNTRRAIAITWSPRLDSSSHEPPCVQSLQFIARQGKLNLVVYIRSNDMLSAWGANAYAFAHLLGSVAEQVIIPPGYMETISTSAHVYNERDVMELNQFRRKLTC